MYSAFGIVPTERQDAGAHVVESTGSVKRFVIVSVLAQLLYLYLRKFALKKLVACRAGRCNSACNCKLQALSSFLIIPVLAHLLELSPSLLAVHLLRAVLAKARCGNACVCEVQAL